MKTFLKELVVAFGLSLVWALAWFRPLLSRSQEQEGTAFPLGDMFFSTTNPELLIGKGVDLFGSIWMVFLLMFGHVLDNFWKIFQSQWRCQQPRVV